MFSCVGDGRWPICAGEGHTISLFSSHWTWPRLFCVIFQGSKLQKRCMHVAWKLHGSCTHVACMLHGSCIHVARML